MMKQTFKKLQQEGAARVARLAGAVRESGEPE